MHANNSSDERGGFQFMFQSITPVRPSHWFLLCMAEVVMAVSLSELVACSAFFELYRYRPTRWTIPGRYDPGADARVYTV